MKTTELIRPPAASDGRAASPGDAGHTASRPASERSTPGEMLAEIVPLVGAVAGEGPPVIFLAAPWLFLALILSGPFAFLVTLVAVMLAAATALVALTGAIVAVPYLLIRGLHRYRARRAFGHVHAARFVPVGSTRVAA